MCISRLMSRLDDLPRRDVATRVQRAILEYFGLTEGFSVFVTSQLPHDAGLGYYSDFATLRDLLHKAGRDRFERGVVAVVGTQGKVDRLEASFELNGRPVGCGVPAA